MTAYTLTAAKGTYAVTGNTSISLSVQMHDNPIREKQRQDRIESTALGPNTSKIRWHRDWRW